MRPDLVQTAVKIIRRGGTATEISQAIGCTYAWAIKMVQDFGRSVEDPDRHEIIVPPGGYPLAKQLRDYYFCTPLEREECGDFDRYTAIGWRIAAEIEPDTRIGVAADLLDGVPMGRITLKWGVSTRVVRKIRDWVINEFEKNGLFKGFIQRVEVHSPDRPVGFNREGSKFFRFFRRGRKKDGLLGWWVGYLLIPQARASMPELAKIEARP